jgi:hypothetical protein
VGLGGGLRKFATSGLTGAGVDSVDGRGGGRTPGSFRGFCVPGKGASESDIYVVSRIAPVSTPPRLRSFGIPPANKPPSCGADWMAGPLSSPPSLLLRNLFVAALVGMGGASPSGGLDMPGTGGAPRTAGPRDFPPSFMIEGADRSFVTAFFSRVPFVISSNSAPLSCVSELPDAVKFPGGGGGGGGPPMPGGGGGGGGGGSMLEERKELSCKA